MSDRGSHLTLQLRVPACAHRRRREARSGWRQQALALCDSGRGRSRRLAGAACSTRRPAHGVRAHCLVIDLGRVDVRGMGCYSRWVGFLKDLAGHWYLNVQYLLPLGLLS